MTRNEFETMIENGRDILLRLWVTGIRSVHGRSRDLRSERGTARSLKYGSFNHRRNFLTGI